MKKIAILFDGNIYDRKGMINATLMRIKHLKTATLYHVDCFIIMKYGSKFSNRISNYKMEKGSDVINIEGIEIKVLWTKFFVIDSLLHRFGIGFSLTNEICKVNIAPLFVGYDLISAHSYLSGMVASFVCKRYSIPYVVTWHGSDIHTYPVDNNFIFKKTKIIIENAATNIYVCHSLYETSLKITKNQKTIILYNGVNEIFKKKSFAERLKLQKEFGVIDTKVVAFVGNVIPIKNVLTLPDIFEKIIHSYTDKVEFWIVGDGYLKDELGRALDRICGLNYRLWGNQESEKIPDILNCVDVLVLPSFNEGLPLILGEALSCGANAVASNVGGIPEVLNEEDVFDFNEKFVENISKRIVYMLENEVEQKIKPEFNWSFTAQKEDSIYKKLLSL